MELDVKSVNKIIKTILENSNYNFTDYSEKSITRRLSRIVIEYKLNVDDFCLKLSTDNDFLEEIVRDITVNTTEFFRDFELWLYIKNSLIKEFVKKDELNIWHAGCSNGQELYSMMIMLAENNLLEKSNIIGSDINSEIINIASKGRYKYYLNETFEENVNKVFSSQFNRIKSKYLEIDKLKKYITIKKELINKPTFKIHDLVKLSSVDNKSFDIIFCRNVLIYFNLKLQNKLFKYFSEHLNNGGYLIIGFHESILGEELKYFKKLDYQVYKKI